jgi:hypothetical protein
MAGVVVGGGGDRDGPLMARQGCLRRARRPLRGGWAGGGAGCGGRRAAMDQPTSKKEG